MLSSVACLYIQESPASPTKKEDLKFPGHVIRKDHSCHSIVDESELPPRPLSTNEAEYLDQECFERFIKINSYYITGHHVSHNLLCVDSTYDLVTNFSIQMIEQSLGVWGFCLRTLI